MSSKYLTVLRALELGHTFTFKDGPRIFRDDESEMFQVRVEIDDTSSWVISLNDFIAACEDIPTEFIQELEDSMFMEMNDDITLDGSFGRANKVRDWGWKS